MNGQHGDNHFWFKRQKMRRGEEKRNRRRISRSFVVFMVTHSFSFLGQEKTNKKSATDTYTDTRRSIDCDKTQTEVQTRTNDKKNRNHNCKHGPTIINSIEFEITSVRSHKSCSVSHKHTRIHISQCTHLV